MFKFDLAMLDDRDIRDTVSAMDIFLSTVAGQANNPCFEYLRDGMKTEAVRRKVAEDAEEDSVVNVILPLAESTDAHVWALLKFTSAVIQAGVKGRPSEMLRFFARIIDEIQSVNERYQSAVVN
jgi:hypothetical protein